MSEEKKIRYVFNLIANYSRVKNKLRKRIFSFAKICVRIRAQSAVVDHYMPIAVMIIDRVMWKDRSFLMRSFYKTSLDHSVRGVIRKH